MAAVGRNDYVPHLIKAYIEDYHSVRLAFNIQLALYVFDEQPVRQAIDSVLQHSYVIDKEKFRQELLSAYKQRTSSDNAIIGKQEKERWRILYISSLRNYPIHGSVGDYLRILQDPKESEELKIAMLQALAWYRLSRERQNIAQACRRLQRDKHASPAVRTEAERTYYRLINE